MQTTDEKRRSVLIVEDDPDLLEITELWFQEALFQTVTCSGRMEAMFKLKNQKFDCIVLDIRIEGGSSNDLILNIRSRKGDMNTKTPIVILSGFIDRNFITQHKANIQGAFVKPVPKEKLVDKVLNLSTTSTALPQNCSNESH